MPVDLKGYQVFIASPGGLDKERTIFCDTIEEHNKCDAIVRGVQFIPVGWEETLGGKRSPQDIINDELRECDYFVMVLYDRWGTPPRREGDNKYSSGTEEEYYVALECFDNEKYPMRQIVVFFKQIDERRLSDPGEQLKRVLAFRERLESGKTHLYHVYDTVDSFEKWLRRYLAQWVRDDESGNTAKVKQPVAPYDETATKAKDMSKLEPPEKIPEPLENEFEGLLKKADELVDNGKITEAEIIYSEAVVRSNSPDVINAYGNFLYRLGRLGQAEVMYKRVMEVAKNIKNEELESVACGNLGIVYCIRGDLVKAEEVFNKILEIHKRLGSQEGMARDYGNLGVIYETRGDLVKAEEMYKRALETNEKLKRLEGMAINYGNLGIIYKTRGDLDKAEEMHKRALEIDEKLGSQEGIAADYGNLGLIYQKRGDLVKAEKMHLKSLAIEEMLGHLEGMASDCGNLGVVYEKRGDLVKAEEMHKKALEINEKLGRLMGMAINYGNLGIIYQTRGDLVKAREYWVKARDLYAKIGMPNEVEKVQGWIDSASLLTG